MANTKNFVLFAIVAIALPIMAMATEHIVGDDNGWTINFDFEKWAHSKVFHVGDTLVFNYDPNHHNVIKVGAQDYKSCNGTGSETLKTGKDVITLKIPGKKWYICGVRNHCSELGQKLSINVVTADFQSPETAPSPSTTPQSYAHGVFATWHNIFPVAFVAMVALVMV